MEIRAPIAIGELIDKITILELKSERIADPDKLRHVRTELGLLRELQAGAGLNTAAMQPHARELKSINSALWDIEDEIRDHETQEISARGLSNWLAAFTRPMTDGRN